MFATDSKPLKMESESLVFNNSFEIIRTQWNSNAYQSNQNHDGKIQRQSHGRSR